jgi:hypothetical protein
LTSGSAYSTLTSLQRKRYLFVCINRRAEENPKGTLMTPRLPALNQDATLFFCQSRSVMPRVKSANSPLCPAKILFAEVAAIAIRRLFEA